MARAGRGEAKAVRIACVVQLSPRAWSTDGGGPFQDDSLVRVLAVLAVQPEGQNGVSKVYLMFGSVQPLIMTSLTLVVVLSHEQRRFICPARPPSL